MAARVEAARFAHPGAWGFAHPGAWGFALLLHGAVLLAMWPTPRLGGGTPGFGVVFAEMGAAAGQGMGAEGHPGLPAVAEEEAPELSPMEAAPAVGQAVPVPEAPEPVAPDATHFAEAVPLGPAAETPPLVAEPTRVAEPVPVMAPAPAVADALPLAEPMPVAEAAPLPAPPPEPVPDASPAVVEAPPAPPVVAPPRPSAAPRQAPARSSQPDRQSATSVAPASGGSPGANAASLLPAAPRSASGALLPDQYRAGLSAALRRHLRYPMLARERGLEGEVLVQFSVARDGAVHGVRILRSSGVGAFDSEAMALLARVSPLPPLPRGWPAEAAMFAAPIRFTLR